MIQQWHCVDNEDFVIPNCTGFYVLPMQVYEYTGFDDASSTTWVPSPATIMSDTAK